jgi:S-formylglutathione hydrolase FrmB
MTRRVLGLVLAVAALAVVAVPAVRADTTPPFASECDAPGTALAVGTVDCFRMPSADLGATTAVSYFIPPACDPTASPLPRCPVMYYLHGTGGSYKEGTGSKGAGGNAWVKALTSGPPVDPRTISDPWRYADPSTWVSKPPLDMIIVAPHGLTLPGGYGVQPNDNPFWFDWNPRYAKGGDSQRYDTPAPKFESFLTDELVPYVDSHFPTGSDRTWRAIVGYSMGGIGALANGLKHPDVWSSVGARSGGGFPFAALGGVAPGGLGEPPLPVAVPYTRLPGVVPTAAPSAVWQPQFLYGPAATVGFGDFVADNIWWRQSQAADFVPDARAFDQHGQQVEHIKFFVNDAVPRRTQDIENPNPLLIGFEAILNPTSRYLDALLHRYGVEDTFNVGPGDHSSTYGNPYFREQLEQQYAHLNHRDGNAQAEPWPRTFDFRSIRNDFSAWGWHFSVNRKAIEFLTVTDASCSGLTLQGTGVVTVTVPAECHTAVKGNRTFSVDLGSSHPTDEPASSAIEPDGYGAVAHVTLTRASGH